MNTPYYLRLKIRRLMRVLLMLLTLLPTLILAATLVNAGKNGNWSASDLQLQNVSDQPRPITITWYNQAGDSAQPVSDRLEAGQSKLYMPPQPLTGAVRLDDDSGEVLGVVTHLDDNPPGAAQWPLLDDAAVSFSAHVPYFVHPAQADAPFSRLTIHNLEPTQTVKVKVRLFSHTGMPVHEWLTDIPPLNTTVATPASMGFSQHGEFAVVVEANGKIIVGAERMDGVAAFSSLQAVAQGSRKVVAPLFVLNYPDSAGTMLNSTLAIQNIGPVAATGALSYYEGISGIATFTRSFTIAPYALFTWTASLMMPPSHGHIVAIADQPIAMAVMGNSRGPSTRDVWDYTAVAIETTLPDAVDRRLLYAPAFFSRYMSWSSRLSLVNLSDEPAVVWVEYSSLMGEVTTTLVSLAGQASALLEPDLPNGFERASVKMTADQPIAAAILTVNGALPVGLDCYMAYEAQYAPPVSGPVNHPPDTPHSPAPADGATGVPLTQTLAWQGGDIDGDAVTYSVAFGNSNPPPLITTTVLTTFTPSGLVSNTTYYWIITATDGISKSAGPLWQFTTVAGGPVNHPPDTPHSPAPADGATGVPLTQTLAWQGGDIDGDAVTYSVAFGSSNPPPLITTTVLTTFTPSDLMTGTTYYWIITATDGISESIGSLWRFTTVGVIERKIYLPVVLRNF